MRFTIKQAVGFGNEFHYYTSNGERFGVVKGNRSRNRSFFSHLLRLLRFSTLYSHFYKFVDQQDRDAAYVEKGGGSKAPFYIFSSNREKLGTVQNVSRLAIQLNVQQADGRKSAVIKGDQFGNQMEVVGAAGQLIGRFNKKRLPEQINDWTASGDQYEVDVVRSELPNEVMLVLPVIFHVLFFGDTQVPKA
ncbi:hypothetical protein [Halobacillus andaensis]|uniref:hypothetical protein n=1 Tax=Halobacillus andaensis TaxID=1176239 RepID=UPI003D76265B